MFCSLANNVDRMFFLLSVRFFCGSEMFSSIGELTRSDGELQKLALAGQEDSKTLFAVDKLPLNHQPKTISHHFLKERRSVPPPPY